MQLQFFCMVLVVLVSKITAQYENPSQYSGAVPRPLQIPNAIPIPLRVRQGRIQGQQGQPFRKPISQSSTPTSGNFFKDTPLQHSFQAFPPTVQPNLESRPVTEDQSDEDERQSLTTLRENLDDRILQKQTLLQQLQNDAHAPSRIEHVVGQSLPPPESNQILPTHPIHFRPDGPKYPIPRAQRPQQNHEENNQQIPAVRYPQNRPQIQQQNKEESFVPVLRQPPQNPPKYRPQPQQPQPQQQPRAQPQDNRQELVKKQYHDRKTKKPVSQTLRKYMTDNPDGSITWGYENDDGTFKEETIGKDCITRGKYGYIDPDGVKREYSYEMGLPCDHKSEAEEDENLEEDRIPILNNTPRRPRPQ